MKYSIFTLTFILVASCSIIEVQNPTNNQKNDSEEELFVKYYDIPDSECQKIKFSQRDTTLLIGEKLTKFKVYPNSFDSNDDSLTFFLKEVYDLGTAVYHNLQTLTDDNEILQTQGMFFFKVLDKNGKEIQLKEKKVIDVIFSDSMKIDGYLLYDGKIEDNSIKWTSPSRPIGNTYDVIEYSVPEEGDEGYEIYQISEQDYVDYLGMKKSNRIELDLNIFRLRSLGWKNLDKPFHSNRFITFSVTVDPNFDYGRMYSVYSDSQILLEFNQSGNKFSSNKIIPDERQTLLFVAEINGEIHYHFLQDLKFDKNKFFRITNLRKTGDISNLITSEISSTW